jgi:hypothetical protein
VTRVGAWQRPKGGLSASGPPVGNGSTKDAADDRNRSEPHKRSHTCGAVEAPGQLHGELTTPAKASGFERLLAWSWYIGPERIWAIEDCRISKPLNASWWRAASASSAFRPSSWRGPKECPPARHMGLDRCLGGRSGGSARGDRHAARPTPRRDWTPADGRADASRAPATDHGWLPHGSAVSSCSVMPSRAVSQPTSPTRDSRSADMWVRTIRRAPSRPACCWRVATSRWNRILRW